MSKPAIRLKVSQPNSRLINVKEYLAKKPIIPVKESKLYFSGKIDRFEVERRISREFNHA